MLRILNAATDVDAPLLTAASALLELTRGLVSLVGCSLAELASCVVVHQSLL